VDQVLIRGGKLTVVEGVFRLCNQGATKWVSGEARYFGCWTYRCQSSCSWLCFGTIERQTKTSIGTIILIILIIALLGGFSGIGGGPFYGTGYYGGGGLGLVVIILIILLLMGRI
jgi:hypothetical protein